MLQKLLCIACLVALGSPAYAAGFQTRTMRDAMPTREIERPLVLGKGWLELSLINEYKNADGYWDSEGKAQDFESAEWLYTTQKAAIRYGLARRSELFWTIPTHYVRLRNDDLGTDTQAFGIGDPEFGYIHELYRSTAPATSIAAKVWYKAPAANESPGNYVGGPNTFSSIVMTTGTPDLGVAVDGKQQLGPVAVQVGMGFIHRIPRVVMYLIETENSQFQARIKPGNVVYYDTQAMLQLGPAVVRTAWRMTQRKKTLIGTATEGLFSDQNLDAIEGSDGTSIDMKNGILLQISQGIDLSVDVSTPLQGEDLQFFPIEDIHPTRGTTYMTALELRY
jgi:hypothetical protein